MRAIVNIMTGKAAKTVGWRAQEVRVAGDASTVRDILSSAYLAGDSTSLYDLVAGPHGLRPEYALFVSGELFREKIDWERAVTDSEQMHLCDWPMVDS